MKKGIFYSCVLFGFTCANVLAAVDKSSSSYNAGALAGKIFIAVFVVLIVKKIFFNKK